MSAVHGPGFLVSRVARKNHRCDCCGTTIANGTRYWRHSLPPFTEPYESSPGWKTLIACGPTTAECSADRDPQPRTPRPLEMAGAPR